MGLCKGRNLRTQELEKGFGGGGQAVKAGDADFDLLRRVERENADVSRPRAAVDGVVHAEAQTCLDHRVGCERVHGRELEVGRHAAARKHTCVVNVPVGEGFDVGFLGEGRNGKGRERGERVRRREPRGHFVPEDRVPAVRALALAYDAEVDFEAVQTREQVGAVTAAELNLNAGITGVKRRNHPRKRRVERAVRRTDCDRADVCAAYLRGKLGAVLAGLQQGADSGEQPFAGGRWAHAAVLAVQQGKAGFRLKRRNHAADARHQFRT